MAVRRFNFSWEPPEILYLSPSWFPSLLLCFHCFLICCYVTCLLVVIKSTLLFLRFVLSHSMDSFFVPSVLVSRCPFFALFCGDSEQLLSGKVNCFD